MPQLAYAPYFGLNLAEGACAGLAPRVAELMADVHLP